MADPTPKNLDEFRKETLGELHNIYGDEIFEKLQFDFTGENVDLKEVGYFVRRFYLPDYERSILPASKISADDFPFKDTRQVSLAGAFGYVYPTTKESNEKFILTLLRISESVSSDPVIKLLPELVMSQVLNPEYARQKMLEIAFTNGIEFNRMRERSFIQSFTNFISWMEYRYKANFDNFITHMIFSFENQWFKNLEEYPKILATLQTYTRK